MGKSIVDAIGVSIDQFIDTAVSFNIDVINSSNTPFGKDQKLIDLFCEGLNSQLDADFD